jgi:acylphosphatase
VSGWVRNRRDGTVELVAEGTAEQLDDLVGWCHQGPPMAQVESVEATRSQASEALGGFDVRPTT